MTTAAEWVSLTQTTYEDPEVEAVRFMAVKGVMDRMLSRHQATWLIKEAIAESRGRDAHRWWTREEVGSSLALVARGDHG